MTKQPEPAENTSWLKSPLTENTARLQPLRELVLRSYFGPRRSIKVVRTYYSIGSGESCDLRINDPFVSPLHAELKLEPGGAGYFVQDAGSRNGTFLNGVRVQSAPLPSQGTLRFGRSALSWTEGESGELLQGNWVFADPGMRETVAGLRRMAKSSLPVLLLGETGTGKDILARMLHQWGNSASGPFVPVNGALTGSSLAESELFGHKKGAFTGAETPRLGALRSAHGGTLFLDEIGDIPEGAQVKLLRALESGEVKALGSDQVERADFRLVAATSRDIDQKLEDGSFRLDLYYRVAGFVVHVPPLRERPQDTLAIARKLALDQGLELDKESEGKLLSYRWPGNVRELRSCIERGTVMARSESSARILAQHLVGLELGALALPKARARPRTLEESERDCIHASLERNGWARSIAAKELGIARSTLFDKMRRLGLRDRANP